MPIFGLSSSADYETYRRKNLRRSVQQQFPKGSFPITGLLSLADEEWTNDQEFAHWEERWVPPTTQTASQGSSKGPILDSSGADAGDPISLVADTEYIMCIDDATVFREGSVVRFELLNSSAEVVAVTGVVTAITDRSGTPNKLKFRSHAAYADLINGTTNENVDRSVRAIGSSFAQGRSNVNGEYVKIPTRVYNYTQIHRTPFSLPRTTIKAQLEYDLSGPYKRKAKTSLVNHMVGLEQTLMFGVRKTYTKSIVSGDEAVSSTGEGLIQTMTGGLLWHMEQWEAADSPYRGGTGAPAITGDTDENKRIIKNASGTINLEWFDSMIERTFRHSNNTSDEKLVVLGNGAALVLNNMWRNHTQLTSRLPLTDTYGMNMISYESPFGTLHFKTHPLFNADDEWRYNMLIIDVNNIKYRPMQDSDTALLKNRQANDADHRKDEYLTEAGFEFWMPETNMLIKNVRAYVP